MSNPALFFDDWENKPLVIPVSNCAYMQLNISTRIYDAVAVWGDGITYNFTLYKNIDATISTPTLIYKDYSPNFTGDIKVYLKGGLKDVYSFNFRQGVITDNSPQQYNIQDLGLFLAQMPNLYSYRFYIYAYGSANIQPTIIGDFAQTPDSVERIFIASIDVKNRATALVLNFNNFKNTSKLKWFMKENGYGLSEHNALRFIGDIAKIPPLCTRFYIQSDFNYSIANNSAITYTSGKVWASSFDTLQIPLPLTTAELDNLLIDMDNSITTKIGDGVIALYGYRSSISDTVVASLQSKGFTVNVNRFYQIVNLPFQNNFTDSGEMGMTFVAGGTSNLPTFALSGRKPGEYCAVFNGSQSIKTTANLPVNSDKVTIAFWIKTTQSTNSAIVEMSPNWTSTNAFVADILNSKIIIGEQTTSSNRNIISSVNNINDNTWKHIVIVFDRANPTSSKITIYINGVSVVTTSSSNGETTGKFVNNILFIGQRAGNSLGFVGSLTRLKMYNYPFTPSEVTNLYNSEL